MDWNIFWSAFGAIGTTLGSLITAGAVVVAVKQYKQPLNKIIKVDVSSAVSSFLGRGIAFYCVSIKNKGLRQVYINSINLKGNGKNLWLNNAQYHLYEKIVFPVKIEPEECKDIYFEVDSFRNEVKKAVDEKVLKRHQKLVFYAIDSFGKKYYCRTNVKVKELIK